MSARNLPRLTAMVSPLGLVLHTSFKAATTEHRSGGKTYWSDVQVRFVYKRRAYSCGVWQHDHIEIIANDQGNRTMPSVVAFTDTASLIDDATKNQVAMNPRPRLAPPLLHLIQIGCSPSLSLPVA
ncbi:hypothetical protein FF1_007588 [Malus domestica]